jgi:hypothetical protein
MARNTTLANALLMLKGELGYVLTANVATAQDQELYTLLDNKQKWLAGEYDWQFLNSSQNFVTVGAGVGNRYQTLPTGLNYERPVKVSAFWGTIERDVAYGIGQTEYNTFPSGDGNVAVRATDPIMRWDIYSETQFEVWPIPVTQQILRFDGQRTLTDLKSGGSSYVTSATLDLDDLMVVYFAAAAKLAAGGKPNAQQMLGMAQDRLNKVRGAYPVRSRVTSLNSYDGERRPIRTASMIIVAQG